MGPLAIRGVSHRVQARTRPARDKVWREAKTISKQGLFVPEKILSGGQATADRAGLNVAIGLASNMAFVPGAAERKTEKSLSIINLPSGRVF